MGWNARAALIRARRPRRGQAQRLREADPLRGLLRRQCPPDLGERGRRLSTPAPAMVPI